MNESKIILVSQLGVNDEKATLVKWMVNEGDSVLKGEILCVLETTKAAYDIESDCNGYIAHLAAEDDEVLVSQPLAVIAPNSDQAMYDKQVYKAKVSKEKDRKKELVNATKKAENLAIKHNVVLKNIRPSSGEIIKESDVIEYMTNSQVDKIRLNLDIEDGLIPVAIYGAGLGGVTIQETLSLGCKYKAVCFIDDNKEHAQSLIGLPIFHGGELGKLKKKGIKHAIVGIANGAIRQKIKNTVQRTGFELINAVHPKAFISPSAKIGVSNHIKAGAIVETNTIIGDCCIIDNGAVIAHDNFIENGCHIAPGATFGSSISLGKNTVVGIGVSISTNIQIGKSCIISVGASVTQNIEDHSVVDGVPGKVIGKTKF